MLFLQFQPTIPHMHYQSFLRCSFSRLIIACSESFSLGAPVFYLLFKQALFPLKMKNNIERFPSQSDTVSLSSASPLNPSPWILKQWFTCIARPMASRILPSSGNETVNHTQAQKLLMANWSFQISRGLGSTHV